MPRIVAYQFEDGTSPFQKWFDRLTAPGAFEVTDAVRRLEAGNRSNVRSVGDGVHEIRINFGPGYRVYFGSANQGEFFVLLGGSKRRQQKDMDEAKRLWVEHKKRRRKKRSSSDTMEDKENGAKQRFQ